MAERTESLPSPQKAATMGSMDRDNAKHHDFDQRHDGPFQDPANKHEHDATVGKGRRSVQIARSSMGGMSSDDAGSRQNPYHGRRSMQTARERESRELASPRRASTQISRSGTRPSRDFDTRRDGPYGRPSLTMTRRKSSGTPLPMSPEGRRPTLPATEQEKEERQQEELGEAHGPERPEAPSMETLQAFEPEPPALNYTLWTRKWSIIFFWSLIVFDCVAMPLGLYFGLWYGTNLSPNAVFSIVTAALGGVSILEYVLRFRRLWRKDSTCRVIGARRMYLDWFHWNFSAGWFIVVIELIIGTIPTHPPIRLLAMPLVSMLYAFGVELLVVDGLRLFEIPAPIRISSVPKGSQLRPGIYSIIEDVCAVDGSGGTAYREALNRRYEASHIFRAMLRRLGFFWAIGSVTAAVVCTILIFTIQHEAAYVVGWTVPFIWAGVWVVGTYFYVIKKLKEEKIAWTEEIAAKGAV